MKENSQLSLENRHGAHGLAVRPVDHIDHFHSVAVWGNFPPYIADDLAIADQFSLGYVAVDALRGGTVTKPARGARSWFAVVGNQGLHPGLLALVVLISDT